ncbi:MAG: hypothetical protein OXU45_00015 [Candidatus Melainabacteria bacterium]|nr:hypothetical protein [Candidatus Melainabacteria bacterium]
MPFEAQNWITDLGVDPVFLQTNPFTPKKLLDYLAAVAKLQQRFFHPDRWEHEGLSARDSAQIRALFDRAKELNQETLPEAEAVTAQEHLNTAIGPNAKLQRALEFAQLKVEEASHEHQLNTRLEHNYVDMLKRTAATTKSLVDFG